MNRFLAPISARPRPLAARAALAALAGMIVLGTTAWLASPASATGAQPAVEVRHATLYYNLRELSSDQGTRALYRRIVAAAQAVCPGWDSRNLAEFAASRACQREAIVRAIGEIGSARLAAVNVRARAGRG